MEQIPVSVRSTCTLRLIIGPGWRWQVYQYYIEKREGNVSQESSKYISKEQSVWASVQVEQNPTRSIFEIITVLAVALLLQNL